MGYACPKLGVNIDHVATLRQARRGEEPDPVRAAHEAELGGADIITVHLREDRRHIQDRDVVMLVQVLNVRLNLEMAATPEMAAVAKQVGPGMVTLVPEGRREVTTEGGLNVVRDVKGMRDFVKRLKGVGCTVSAFIDADEDQIEASAEAGFEACEVHTGPFAAAFADAGGDTLRGKLAYELEKIVLAAEGIRAAGMRFHAGHALNYHNVGLVAEIPGLAELHIGHAIVSRAVFCGLRDSVRDMKALIEKAYNGGRGR